MIRLIIAVIIFISLSIHVSGSSGSTSSMAFVKVCGPRELKEVTETVCSMLAKRDSLALAWSIRRRPVGQRVQTHGIPTRGLPTYLPTTLLPSAVQQPTIGIRGKRSIMKRLAPEDMASLCCRQPCPISYYSLFCDE